MLGVCVSATAHGDGKRYVVGCRAVWTLDFKPGSVGCRRRVKSRSNVQQRNTESVCSREWQCASARARVEVAFRQLSTVSLNFLFFFPSFARFAFEHVRRCARFGASSTHHPEYWQVPEFTLSGSPQTETGCLRTGQHDQNTARDGQPHWLPRARPHSWPRLHQHVQGDSGASCQA